MVDLNLPKLLGFMGIMTLPDTFLLSILKRISVVLQLFFQSSDFSTEKLLQYGKTMLLISRTAICCTLS